MNSFCSLYARTLCPTHFTLYHPLTRSVERIGCGVELRRKVAQSEKLSKEIRELANQMASQFEVWTRGIFLKILIHLPIHWFEAINFLKKNSKAFFEGVYFSHNQKKLSNAIPDKLIMILASFSDKNRKSKIIFFIFQKKLYDFSVIFSLLFQLIDYKDGFVIPKRAHVVVSVVSSNRFRFFGGGGTRRTRSLPVSGSESGNVFLSAEIRRRGEALRWNGTTNT